MNDLGNPIVLARIGESAALMNTAAEFADSPDIELDVVVRDWSDFEEQDRARIASVFADEDRSELIDAFQDGNVDRDVARRILNGWKQASRRGRWGEIVVNSRSSIPVPVVAAAAPDAANSEVRGEFAWSKGRKAGLQIKLGGWGLDASAKYTVMDDLTLKTVDGEAGVGIIRIPAFRVVREFFPEGAAEPLLITRYELIRDQDPDIYLKDVTVGELLISSVDESEVSIEQQSGAGSTAFSFDLDVELSFGQDIGGSEASEAIGSWSISVGIEGSVEATLSWDLPRGTYSRHRLGNPWGFALVAG